MANFKHPIKFYEYHNGGSLLALLDPFDQVPEELNIQHFLGLIPNIIAPTKDADWCETIKENYGFPCDDFTQWVHTKGYIWRENTGQDPDLLPIAIFENPRTREKVAVYKYAFVAVFAPDLKLKMATRLD